MKERGQGLVELALIVPLLLILLVGLAEVTALLHDYMICMQASREGARYAVRTDIVGDDAVYGALLGAHLPIEPTPRDTVIITHVRKREPENDYEVTSRSVYGKERESLLTPEWWLEQQTVSAELWDWQEGADPEKMDFVVVEVFYVHDQLTGLFSFIEPEIVLHAHTIMRMGKLRKGYE